MSKADEMFDKLGYSNDNQSSENCIEYEIPSKVNNYQTIWIIFDLEVRTISKLCQDWESSEKLYPEEIKVEELQAINEKVKELGWLE